MVWSGEEGELGIGDTIEEGGEASRASREAKPFFAEDERKKQEEKDAGKTGLTRFHLSKIRVKEKGGFCALYKF